MAGKSVAKKVLEDFICPIWECMQQNLRINSKDGQRCPVCKTPCYRRDLRDAGMLDNFLSKWRHLLSDSDESDEDIAALAKTASKSLADAKPKSRKRKRPQPTAAPTPPAASGAGSGSSGASAPADHSSFSKTSADALQTGESHKTDNDQPKMPAAPKEPKRRRTESKGGAGAAAASSTSDAIASSSAQAADAEESQKSSSSRRRVSRLQELERRREKQAMDEIAKQQQLDQEQLDAVMAQSRQEAALLGIPIPPSPSSGDEKEAKEEETSVSSSSSATGASSAGSGTNPTVPALEAMNSSSMPSLPSATTAAASLMTGEGNSRKPPSTEEKAAALEFHNKLQKSMRRPRGTKSKAMPRAANSPPSRSPSKRKAAKRAPALLKHVAELENGSSSSDSDSDSDKGAGAGTKEKAMGKGQAKGKVGNISSSSDESDAGKTSASKAKVAKKSKKRSSSDSEYSGSGSSSSDTDSDSSSDLEMVARTPPGGKTELIPPAALAWKKQQEAKAKQMHQGVLHATGRQRSPSFTASKPLNRWRNSKFFSLAKVASEVGDEGKPSADTVKKYLTRAWESIGAAGLEHRLPPPEVPRYLQYAHASGAAPDAAPDADTKEAKVWSYLAMEKSLEATVPILFGRDEGKAVPLERRVREPDCPPANRLPIVIALTSGSDMAPVIKELKMQLNELIEEGKLQGGARVCDKFERGVTTHVVCTTKQAHTHVVLELNDGKAASPAGGGSKEGRKLSKLELLKRQQAGGGPPAPKLKPGQVAVPLQVHRACRRTTKALRGLAEGCWVLDASWVERMSKVQAWVPEDEFEVDADTEGFRVPRASRVTRMRGRSGLLRGWVVVIADSEEPQVQTNSLRSVLESAGATVLILRDKDVQMHLRKTAGSLRTAMAVERCGSTVPDGVDPEEFKEQVIVSGDDFGPVTILADTGGQGQKKCSVPTLSSSKVGIKLDKQHIVPAPMRRAVGPASHPRDVMNYDVSCKDFLARGRAGAGVVSQADGGDGAAAAAARADSAEIVFRYGQRDGVTPVCAAVPPCMELSASKGHLAQLGSQQRGRPSSAPRKYEQPPRSNCGSDEFPTGSDLGTRLGCSSIGASTSPLSFTSGVSQALQHGYDVVGLGNRVQRSQLQAVGNGRSGTDSSAAAAGSLSRSASASTSMSTSPVRFSMSGRSAKASALVGKHDVAALADSVREWSTGGVLADPPPKKAFAPGSRASRSVQLWNLQRARWEMDVMRRQLLTDCIIIHSAKVLPSYGSSAKAAGGQARGAVDARSSKIMDRVLDIGTAYMRPVVDARWVFACVSTNQLQPVQDYLLFGGFGGRVNARGGAAVSGQEGASS